jgi:hypothetical protein
LLLSVAVRFRFEPTRLRFGLVMHQFLGLDFVYSPSTDVARDVEHFTSAPGTRLVFAIEAFGTRVAMVQLTETPPALVLAGHLEGERPILVYRVALLEETIDSLERAGWQAERRFEIPHGPGCVFITPGGQRIAIYELTRPDTAKKLVGRRDF